MDAGFFGPETLTWKVTGQTVMLLGGPRALLMQLAHPLVAAGVNDHSSFRDDPFKRLTRTLDATLGVVFGDTASAGRSAAGINAVHGRVHGVLAESVGRFPAGTPYDARDPELLLWVHATLIDTTLEVYPRFVRPLDAHEMEALYQESKTAARLLMVPDEIVPEDLAAFRGYMDRMLASDAIAVGSMQRALAEAVLRPPVPLLPRRLRGLGQTITIGLLPDPLRRAYGLELTPARRRLFELSPALIRRVRPLLPSPARRMPQARRAYRRVGA